MAEYIEREAAIRAVVEAVDAGLAATSEDIAEILDDLPAADAAPVRHGRWIEGAEHFSCGNRNAECSKCGNMISWGGCDEDWNYCPNCGARMDGGTT